MSDYGEMLHNKTCHDISCNIAYTHSLVKNLLHILVFFNIQMQRICKALDLLTKNMCVSSPATQVLRSFFFFLNYLFIR